MANDIRNHDAVIAVLKAAVTRVDHMHGVARSASVTPDNTSLANAAADIGDGYATHGGPGTTRRTSDKLTHKNH